MRVCQLLMTICFVQAVFVDGTDPKAWSSRSLYDIGRGLPSQSQMASCMSEMVTSSMGSLTKTFLH